MIFLLNFSTQGVSQGAAACRATACTALLTRVFFSLSFKGPTNSWHQQSLLLWPLRQLELEAQDGLNVCNTSSKSSPSHHEVGEDSGFFI